MALEVGSNLLLGFLMLTMLIAIGYVTLHISLFFGSLFCFVCFNFHLLGYHGMGYEFFITFLYLEVISD
jgi:hypothetical protein